MRSILRDLRIGAKISILVGLTLLLMGLVVGFGLRQINMLGKEVEAKVEEDLPLTEALSRIVFHRLEQSIHLERAIQFGKRMAQDKAAKHNFEVERENFLTHGRAAAEEIERNRALVERMTAMLAEEQRRQLLPDPGRACRARCRR